MQRENIKAFEPKPQRVKDLYNHTHELMKRLVWSARKQSPHILFPFLSLSKPKVKKTRVTQADSHCP
jgi:hypothetical protein